MTAPHHKGILWGNRSDGRIPPYQWNAFVELVPLWMAPNMVTLIGFMFIVGNVFLIQIFVPDLVGPVRMPCLDNSVPTGC